MSDLPWFRMYAESVDDEKLRLLAFEDRWHFVALLCLKAQGTLDSDAPFLERRIALKLGLQLPQLTEVKRRLIEVSLIDDKWQPIAWGKRQFRSDHSSSERKRNQRIRDRERDCHNDVTTSDCDSPGLEQSRAEQIQSRKNPPTPQGGHAPGLDIHAWDRFLAYRREIRKSVKPASMQAAQRKLAGFGADQAAVVEQSIANGWAGLFDLKDESKKHNGAMDRRVIP